MTIWAAAIASIAFAATAMGQKSIRPQADAKGKVGYIYTGSAEWAIAPKFDEGQSFSEGLAAVRVGKLWGLINRDGGFVLVPTYEDLIGPEEGKIAAKLNGKWTFLHRNLKPLGTNKFDTAGSFKDGCCVVSVDGKYGVIDNTGEYAIRPTYDSILPFSGGLAAAVEKGKCGFVDMNGAIVIPFNYTAASSFRCGLARVRDAGGAVLFINRQGRTVIERLEDAKDFSEGFARAKSNGKWGVVNSSGEWVIAPRFDEIGAMLSGSAIAKVGETEYVVTSEGKIDEVKK